MTWPSADVCRVRAALGMRRRPSTGVEVPDAADCHLQIPARHLAFHLPIRLCCFLHPSAPPFPPSSFPQAGLVACAHSREVHHARMRPAMGDAEQSPASPIPRTPPPLDDAASPPHDASLRKGTVLHKNKTAMPRRAPTVFFMKSSEELERAQDKTAESPMSVPIEGASSGGQDQESLERSVENAERGEGGYCYGVQSLEDIMSVAESMDPSSSHPRPDHSPSVSSGRSSPPECSDTLKRTPSTNTLSLPLTPVLAHSPATGGSDIDGASTPRTGSLKSFRLHEDDDDDNGNDDREDAQSQAVMSSSEEDEEESTSSMPQADPGRLADLHATEASPELVMPSMIMPTRRPFTERGKQFGRLKIMMVGEKGKEILLVHVAEMIVGR